MQRSHQVWLATNGDGPWPCAGTCGEPVLRLGGKAYGIIHHADLNHGNNAIGNLRVMHDGCHIEHHRLISRGTLIADQLRTQIAAGEFGRRLPSYTDLAGQLGVASKTVQRILGDLRDEGIVFIVPSRGTFVTALNPGWRG